MLENKINITFVALARDCAATLPSLFSVMRDLEARSCNVSAIIGENGSRDETRYVLDQAAKSVQLDIVDTSFMAAIPGRLERMARGRETLKNLAKKKNTDYVCVIDLDNVLAKPMNPDLLLKAIVELASNNSIIGVCASSRPVFYDILSLRLQDGMPNEADVLNHFMETREKGKPVRNYFKKLSLIEQCYRRQEEIGTGTGNIFLSAFNGLSIYRAKEYFSGTYIGNFRLCEHVTMNLSLANGIGLSILVSNYLQLEAPFEHTRKSKWKIIRNDLQRVTKNVFLRVIFKWIR